jgi:hypothetical protein
MSTQEKTKNEMHNANQWNNSCYGLTERLRGTEYTAFKTRAAFSSCKWLSFSPKPACTWYDKKLTVHLIGCMHAALKCYGMMLIMKTYSWQSSDKLGMSNCILICNTTFSNTGSKAYHVKEKCPWMC